MDVCRDIILFLLQRGVRTYVRIAKGKEEFIRCCKCRSFQYLIKDSTGGNNQGIEDRQNKVGSGRHRVDSGCVVIAQKSGELK